MTWSFLECRYSQPSVSVGFASVNWTNCGAKIFPPAKNPGNSKTQNLNLPLAAIYMVFTLYVLAFTLY